MRYFKLFLAFGCLLSLRFAIASFDNRVSAHQDALFGSHNNLLRVYFAVQAFLFAATLVCAFKQIPAGWNFGWLSLGLLLFDSFLWGHAPRFQTGTISWILLLVAGFLWYRQKQFFAQRGSGTIPPAITVVRHRLAMFPLVWGVILLVIGCLSLSQDRFVIHSNDGQKTATVVLRKDHPVAFGGLAAAFIFAGLTLFAFGGWQIIKTERKSPRND